MAAMSASVKPSSQARKARSRRASRRSSLRPRVSGKEIVMAPTPVHGERSVVGKGVLGYSIPPVATPATALVRNLVAGVIFCETCDSILGCRFIRDFSKQSHHIFVGT